VLASVDRGEELPVISIEEEWFERVGREVANIRAALSWLAESGAPEKRARLACEARPYWTRKGPLTEPRAWLEEALQSPDLPDGLRRDVLYAVCQVTRVQGDGERCLSAAEEGLALCRRLDPGVPMVLEALRDLGIAHGILGDADRAIALHEEALAEARARGYHDRRITILLCNIGDLELMRRQWSRSREFSRQALALAQQLGDAPDSCIVIHNIGFAFLMEFRFEEARPFFVDALRLAAERGLHTVIPDTLEALAAVLVAEGDAIRAARLLGAAYALRTGLGTMAREIEGERLPVTIAEARAELGDEAYESAFAEGAALTADEAVAYALESID
jgi:tetratricopeptide (TPR) repeat protein